MAHSVKTWYQRTKKGCKRSALLITFLCTYANALCGFIAMIAAIQNRFIEAFIAICFAGVMDFCDGKLARYWGTSSLLGAELDTLCDAISFCLAPTIIILHLFQPQFGFMGICALSFYLCCGLFRLARYNCQQAGQAHADFQGMSAPVSGIFLLLASINFILHFPATSLNYPLLLGFIIFLGLLMISSIPFPSGKMRRSMSKLEGAIFFTILGISLMFVYLNQHLLLCLPFIFYILNALTQHAVRLARANLSSKTSIL